MDGIKDQFSKLCVLIVIAIAITVGLKFLGVLP